MLNTDDPIAQILALPCWHNLKVISVVPLAGLSGGSFQIRLENNLILVARKGGNPARQLGICRSQESQILTLLAANPDTAHRAPALFYHSPQWSILSWVAGDICRSDYLQHQQGLQALAVCLQSVHQSLCHCVPQPEVSGNLPYSKCSEITVPTFNIKQRLALYWQNISPQRKTPLLQQAYHTLSVQNTPRLQMPVLAHHDLHPANMVLTPTGLALIDWEYAAINALACEILLLCDANQFSAQQLQHFLQYYLPDQKTKTLLFRDIERWRPWCHFLTLLWFEVRFQQTREPQYAQWADQYQHALTALKPNT
ncbi:MAG: phosphotransferase [Plesiomonas sp.]|uniref:phosphotransferase n=1 Tax=Plesiomonas sp. TaxID=2486279 RepID=UPI003EE5DD17